MLFCAEAHHISGKCQTKASANQLRLMADIQLSALDNLAAINNPDALTVDTLWYYVPYRSYSSVSVGTVIYESEGNSEFLTLEKLSVIPDMHVMILAESFSRFTLISNRISLRRCT